jgi:hypothetical protein
MLMNEAGAPHLRISPARHGCFVVSCLLLILVSISCVDGAAQSDQVAERNLKAFYEAFLGRQMSRGELREVTGEFIRIHTARGENSASMQKIAQLFGSYAKILREQKGSPLEIHVRHALINASYFEPLTQNTTSLRLLTEPDPVRVVDPGTQRLMTESEVVALANLIYFSTSQGDPRHRELSRRDVDRLVAVLDRMVGNYRDADRMPAFFVEAGVLWAGIRQHWPQLNAGERRQARTYAGKGFMAPMDTEMYAKLLALTPSAAFSHWTEDKTNANLKLFGKQWEIQSLQNAVRSIQW